MYVMNLSAKKILYMKTKQLLPAIFICLLLAACNKSDSPGTQATPIDVSKQWWFDASGNMLTGPGDNQWKAINFTAQELSLFSSLDTANLVGTTTPAAVLIASGSHNALYPNPFSSSQQLPFSFPNGYAGQFVLKLVYVDSLMKPLLKKVVRLQSNAYPPPTTSGVAVTIMPTIPVGRARLYYTLSSATDPHFFKCWGNIQKL